MKALRAALLVLASFFLLGFSFGSSDITKGDKMMKEKNYTKAIEHYTAAIKDKPKDVEGYEKRAAAYMGLKNHDKAISDLDKAISLDQKNPATYFRRAQAHRAKGNLSKAQSDAGKAIELKPKDASYYAFRSEAFLADNNTDKALADLDKAISLDGKNAELYMSRYEIHMQKRDFGKAGADISRAIELTPNEAHYHALKADLLLEQGQHAKAKESYTTAIKLAPNYPYAYRKRGRAGMLMGDVEMAMKDFDKAISQSPSDRHMFITRGNAFLVIGNNKSAMEDYRQAIKCKSEPDTKAFDYISLAVAARRLGGDDFEKAKKEHVAFLKANSSLNPFMVTLSKFVLGIEGVTETAVLAGAGDNMHEAYYHIAEIRDINGDRAGAEEYYKRAASTKADSYSIWTASDRISKVRYSEKTPPSLSFFPDKTYMKGDLAVVEGIALDAFGVESVTVNGARAELKPNGYFSAKVYLKYRQSTVTLAAVDRNGNKTAAEIPLVKMTEEELASGISPRDKMSDRTPPKLTISSTGNYAQSDTLTLSGRASDSSGIKKITVNGSRIDFRPNGEFSANMRLRIGENEFSVTAVDKVGNEITKTTSVKLETTAAREDRKKRESEARQQEEEYARQQAEEQARIDEEQAQWEAEQRQQDREDKQDTMEMILGGLKQLNQDLAEENQRRSERMNEIYAQRAAEEREQAERQRQWNLDQQRQREEQRAEQRRQREEQRAQQQRQYEEQQAQLETQRQAREEANRRAQEQKLAEQREKERRETEAEQARQRREDQERQKREEQKRRDEERRQQQQQQQQQQQESQRREEQEQQRQRSETVNVQHWKAAWQDTDTRVCVKNPSGRFIRVSIAYQNMVNTSIGEGSRDQMLMKAWEESCFPAVTTSVDARFKGLRSSYDYKIWWEVCDEYYDSYQRKRLCNWR